MRPKRYLLFLFLYIFFFIPSSFAQDEDEGEDELLWKRGALLNLNFSQVALKNWVAGGRNSISGTGVANFYANRRAEEYSWKNSLDLSYGLMSRDKSPFIKNDDRMELSSRYGRRIDSNFSLSGRLEFRSQFAPGYEFPEEDSILISDFFSPAYVKGDIGLTYDPNEHFDMTLSPLAKKVTVVQDQELAARGAYGVDPGENVRYEFGSNFRAAVSKSILPNTQLKSEVSLFSNYLEKPGNIDVNFSMLLNMKVNSVITASISTDLIYDDDVHVPVDRNDDGVPDGRGPRLQFKEVLNIGLAFNFQNHEDEDDKE